MRRGGIHSSLRVRSVLVANTVLLTVVGAGCFLGFERPVSYVLAGLCWALAIALGTAAGRHDPYRLEARRLEARRLEARRLEARRLEARRHSGGISSSQ